MISKSKMIIDRSGQKREWRCPRCGLWQMDLSYDLDGKATVNHNPCLKCGADPWTPSWPLRMRWIKK